MSPDKLVYMANQIGKFFASQGGRSRGTGIAEHISKFWDPRMRGDHHRPSRRRRRRPRSRGAGGGGDAAATALTDFE